MPRSQPEQLGVELRPIVEGVVTAAGFDLEEIDIRPAGRRHLVRVVVDSDSGVGLDDIALLSRRIAGGLDQRDEVFGGPYTLEVTSPGVDRPLTERRHWRRARLRLVEVALRESGKITGRVGDASEESVRLLVDGALRDLRYADVERATVVVEFRKPSESDVRMLSGRADGSADEAVDGEVEEQR